MKHLFSVLTIVILFFVACTKKDNLENPDNQGGIPPDGETPKTEINRETITRFFAERLTGKNEHFEMGESLSLSEVTNTQQEIWQAWKEANQNFTEEKLKMSSAHSSSWKLPESLEPNATMHYYFWSNADRPEKGYPLFLYLHGSGNPDSEWQTGRGISNYYDHKPAAHFVPRIPSVNYYRWYQKSKQFAWEKLLRLAYLSGEINANKVFFYGVSEGGYGSQRLASFYADYLAGAGPMAGGEPLINAPVENCRNIAFFLLTGEYDSMFHRNRLTQYTKDEFQKFHTQDPQGWNHNISLEPGSGHPVRYEKAFDWLKDFTRNPHPKKIVWEDFEMHGNRRIGFYNLVIKQRPSNDRTRYTMDIQGNQINLTIDNVAYQIVERSSNQFGNFPTKYSKTYSPSSNGKLILYLNSQLVDLSKEVSVNINGKEVFRGKAELDKKHLINSCAIFFDPERLFPAAVEVSF